MFKYKFNKVINRNYGVSFNSKCEMYAICVNNIIKEYYSWYYINKNNIS